MTTETFKKHLRDIARAAWQESYDKGVSVSAAWLRVANKLKAEIEAPLLDGAMRDHLLITDLTKKLVVAEAKISALEQGKEILQALLDQHKHILAKTGCQIAELEDRDKKADILLSDLRHERNVLQKICAERSDELAKPCPVCEAAAKEEPVGWVDGEGDPYTQHGWGAEPPEGWTETGEPYPVYRRPAPPITRPQYGGTCGNLHNEIKLFEPISSIPYGMVFMPRDTDKFAELLYNIGWRSPCDAQHTRLNKLLSDYEESQK